MNIHSIKTRFDKLESRQMEPPPVNLIRTIVTPVVTIDPKVMKARMDSSVSRCESIRANDPTHPQVVRVILNPGKPDSIESYAS